MELVGHIGVDSGQMMVGDPCYLEQWAGHEFTSMQGPNGKLPEPSGEYSYDGACLATCSEDGVGILDRGLAAVSTTGYGDGLYPVYVERNDEGRVMRLIVDFNDPPDEDEDEEDEDDG